MAIDEQKIVKRCAAGDEKAWEIVYSLYAVKVKAYIKAFMFDSRETEDLCQEIFIELFKSMSSFRAESSLSTFLLRISKNKCISFLRKKTAQKRINDEKNISLSAETEHGFDKMLKDFSQSPDEEFVRKEENEYLLSLLPSLSEDCRNIIRLRFFLVLSYQQIAEKMDLPMGTLCSKLKRCLMYMRKNYERGR